MGDVYKKTFISYTFKFLIFVFFIIALFFVSVSHIQAQAGQISSNASTSLSVNPKYNVLNITSQMQVRVSYSQTRTFSFNISAEYPGNTGLSVTVSREGNISTWITFDTNNSINTTVLSGRTKAINFRVAVPQNTSVGNYTANISALSYDSQLVVMNLAVNVTAEVSWDNLKNSLTTNFSTLNETELGNVSNATIGIPEKGLINFLSQIMDFRGADLDTYVNISNNRIEINSTALPNLNKAAILTLHNLIFNNPIILRDGLLCAASICNSITYNASNGTLIFNVSSFSVYSASDCGNNVCNMGENYSTCPADCPATVTTPTGGGSGGGGGGRPVMSVEALPPTYAQGIKFTVLPVVKEVVIGQASVAGIYVQNLLDESVTLDIDVTGVPSEWISFKPQTLDLNARESKGFTIFISLPENATTGDYRVDLIAKNDKVYAKDFFVLRARRVVPEYDRAMVLRFVEIDTAKGKTNVELNLINAQSRGYPLLEVTENIPKELAQHSREVEFKTPPSKIVKADPVIQWDLLDVKARDNRSIFYSVSRIPTDYAHYIYWPIMQLNMITQSIPAKFKLVDLKIPALYSGKTSIMSLKIENLDDAKHNFKFLMELPDEWKLKPEQIEEIIKEGETKEWALGLSVPRGAESGTYIVRVLFKWDDNIVIREYPVIVQFFPALLVYLGIFLIISILIAYIVSRITRARYKPTRPRVIRMSRDELLNRIRESIRIGKI